MGRHLNFKANLAAAAFAALFVLSASTELSAQAPASVAQFYPAISLNTPLARDAETFEIDRGLDAQCRKMGKKSAVCLCVTHVMKYELTLSEYIAAARLYGQPKNRTTLHRVLKDEGFKATEIDMVEDMERSLIEDDDFALRCAEAKTYYRTSPN